MPSLSTTAVLEGMAQALPTHPQGDDSSDLASSYEPIGLLLHAYLAATGFKLIGLHEDRPLAECQSLAPRLPASWNTGFGSLGFIYTHGQQSSDKTTYIFRVDKMGARVEIRGTKSLSSTSDGSIHRFDVAIRDVIQSSNLPLRITLDSERRDTGDRADLVDKLRSIFASDAAIAGLVEDVRRLVVEPLLRGTGNAAAASAQVQVSTDTETSATASTDAQDERRLREERLQQELQDPNHPLAGRTGATHPSSSGVPLPRPDDAVPDLARPRPGAPSGEFLPPGFDDEFEMNRPPRGGAGERGGLVMPNIGGSGRSPFNIGHDDLHPPGLGPHDPFHAGAGAGFPGRFGGGGGGGGGGMHPTFDDPLFAGQGGRYTGDDDFNPQVPPGARYDPLGPGGGPRFPGPGSGQGGHPFGGGGGII